MIRPAGRYDELDLARDVAVEAAYQAAHVIRLYAGRINRVDVRSKGTHDIVTAADEESQRVIVEILRAHFPEDEILAEEGTDQSTLPSVVAQHNRWIIDPIDGTTNFTNGIPPFAVSIGLQHRDEMVVAVVLDVSRNELFTAIKGRGLYVNGRPSHVSAATTLDESVLTTGFPYRVYGHIDEYLLVLRRFMQEARGLRRPGSASVDLAYVAAGRFDGFFESGLMPWDVAAGVLLVREGGGRVTDYRNRPEAVFSGQIVASNGLIHDAMLDAITPLQDADPLREVVSPAFPRGDS